MVTAHKLDMAPRPGRSPGPLVEPQHHVMQVGGSRQAAGLCAPITWSGSSWEPGRWATPRPTVSSQECRGLTGPEHSRAGTELQLRLSPAVGPTAPNLVA